MGLRSALIRSQVKPGALRLPCEVFRNTRITSYNVCYTKLLRSDPAKERQDKNKLSISVIERKYHRVVRVSCCKDSIVLGIT